MLTPFFHFLTFFVKDGGHSRGDVSMHAFLAQSLLLLPSLPAPAARSAARPRAPPLFASESRRTGLDTRLVSAADRGAAVLIDVENVRGKSGFELTHAELIERATLWTAHRGLYGHVSLIVDHGTVRATGGRDWMRLAGIGTRFDESALPTHC